MAKNKDYNLISLETMVESPFIYITVGNYTFGLSDRKTGRGDNMGVDFPNFMNSITITKINGEVNTYEISLIYAIQAGDDPNVVDHIFSEAAGNREMLISYGDWSQPSHIYKEEKALITNLSQTYSFSNATITYNIAAVSVAVSLMSQSFNFPSVVDKPSNIIKRMLQNNKYKLREIFKGMGSMSKVLQNNLLATDDRVVKLEDRPMTNVLDYLIYLVKCMQPQGNAGGYYALSVSDDARSYMGGAYFVVKKIDIASWEEEDAYELDIGFPGNNLVSSFDVKTNNQWSILYENSAESDLKSTFKIDQNGVLVEEPSLSVTRDKEKLITTQLDTMWW